MKTYIIRRILVLIPVFFGISIIIFALIHMAPGDPYAYMAESGLPKEERELQRLQEDRAAFATLMGYNVRTAYGETDTE